MREEAQQQNLCIYCKQPIPKGTICKGMPDGKKAHLKCYLDHMDTNEENKKPN